LEEGFRGRVGVGVMAGERSKDAFYSRATVEQERVLRCERRVVPEDHVGFQVEAEEFMPMLVEMICRDD
jgi:hypothetical protein